MPLLLLLRPSQERATPSPYPLGYDYYVDQALGSDENDGSIDSPWASLSRVHEFARARSPITATLTLSAATVGERTATLSSGSWSSDHTGWNINLRSGSNIGAATILSVAGTVTTVMVTQEAPATTFGSADWSMTQQLDGATDTVWVGAATWGGPAVPATSSYDNNTLNPQWQPATPTRLEVYFEAGSVMDDHQDDPLRSCFYAAGGANFTLAIYGDEAVPLQILNYGGDLVGGGTVGGSGQAFGGDGDARIEGYNFHISVCGDGISLHNNSTGYFQNGYLEKWQKLGIANIDNSWADFVNVEIVSNGKATIQNSLPTAHSNRCSFLNCKVYADPALVDAGTTVALQALGGGSWSGGQIGSPERAIALNNIRTEADTYADCYFNAESLNAVLATFTRCYGRYTYRQQSNIAIGQTFRNCVWVGAATHKATGQSAFFFRNFNPGGDAQRSVLDCVISGYVAAAAVGASYGTQDADYWIASDSELRFCCFHGNVLDIDADLVSANTTDGGTKIANNLTVDPELADVAAIAAGSVDQADYAVTNAALIGVGHAGGNVGFTAGDL